MRRLAAIPLALLLGCWDFDSLSGTYVPPIIDASVPGDIACAKTPNTLQEDCTQNGDINNNCLVGCEDPTCADHVACFGSKGYKSYGAVVAMANQCPAQTMQTTIYQTLTKPPSCNGSCSCTSNNATCTSTLKVFKDMTDCAAGTPTTATAAVKEGVGANACITVAGAANSAYSVDPFVAGTCAATAGTVALTPNWGTTKTLCDQAALAGPSKLLRFADMKANGIACLVFNGTDTSVCASTKYYLTGSVYYTGTTGSSDCMCSCAAAGGCAIGAGQLNVSDKANCGNNAALTEIKMTTKTGCVTSAAAVVSAVDKIVGPTCTAAGAVTGGFTAAGGFTTCCMN